MTGPFGRGGTTSSTVGNPIASGSYDAGRRRNVSASAEPSRRDARSTPRRNVRVGRMPESRLKANRPPRLWFCRPARGHAEEGCRRFFATGPAVTSPRVNCLAPRMLLRRSMCCGHASGPRPPAQVVEAQDQSGPIQTRRGVSDCTSQTPAGSRRRGRLCAATVFAGARPAATCGRSLSTGRASGGKLLRSKGGEKP